LLKRIIRLGELVGDDERGEQEQLGVADLTDSRYELANLGVDILPKAPSAGLLAVIAGDGESAAVDRHAD
jgi:hypothetical protein